MTPEVVYLTVDAEPDCPPYLWTWRGMAEGMPLLLDLFATEGVAATFFVTGDAARRFPDVTLRVVAEGHELGSHGFTHRPFPRLSREEARREIVDASSVLRTYAPVTAFRAPYLRMPSRYLPLLADDGYRIDCSPAKYKPSGWWPTPSTRLRRLAASVTSSWLRLPPRVRDPVLARLASPVVLFVHPWEFVDFRRAPIPWDCRAGTGEHALGSLREVIRRLRGLGSRFARVSEALGPEEAGR